MWKCPVCGREFSRRNQSHYCGDAPKNVREYILIQEESKRRGLTELAGIIASLDGVHESIKWSMPNFYSASAAIQFAAGKNSISLYVGEEALELFRDRLQGLSYRKAALYLPYDCPLPKELIAGIAEWVLKL